MKPRTEHRLRYALRLVASVFLLSSPCGGQPIAVSADDVVGPVTVTARAPEPRTAR